MGRINNHESLYAWTNEKCIPLVREITFENAEELTDEGLPFLILFHQADDHQSIELFEHEVAKQLMHERSNIRSSQTVYLSSFLLASINCLHADGAKFIHPLQHLGKSTNDLPLLLIDSFRHMFLFPDIKQIS
jgi:endoplasmic reticulum resident protein 44